MNALSQLLHRSMTKSDDSVTSLAADASAAIAPPNLLDTNRGNNE